MGIVHCSLEQKASLGVTLDYIGKAMKPDSVENNLRGCVNRKAIEAIIDHHTILLHRISSDDKVLE